MTANRTPVRLGIGVGGFGALAHLATVLLVFVLPHRLLGAEAASAFIQNWMNPIVTVGRGLAFYVTPILAALVAVYLVWKTGLAVERVLVGFAVGSLAFGLAVTLTNWVVNPPAFRGSTVENAIRAGRHTLRVFGPAFAGALFAHLLADR